MASTLRTKSDTVLWALHSFEAENDDELGFNAGERIILLERDDLYGDGWFQGKNERGETGLFPQSYTSDRPPSFYPFPDSATNDDGTFNASGLPPPPPVTGGPELGAPVDRSSVHGSIEGELAANEEKETLASALLPVPSPPRDGGAKRRLSTSGLSVNSHYSSATRDYDDFDDTASIHSTTAPRALLSPEDGQAHRAALAAAAMRNAEKDQQEERDRIEQRRKEDEEAYERVRREGLIEGLQLSDESDEEEEGRFSPLVGQDELAASPATAKEDGVESAKEIVASGGEATSASTFPSLALSPPAEHLDVARSTLDETISSNDTLATAEEHPDLRPRSDTQPSVYAESTYSTTSSSAAPPLPSPPSLLAEIAPVPVGGIAVVTSSSSTSAPLSTSTSIPGEPVSTPPSTVTESKLEEDDSVLSSLRTAATSTTEAITAGATAAVAGLGVALAAASHNAAREASPEPESQTGSDAPVAVPKEASGVLADVAEEETVVAAPVDVVAAETASHPPVSAASTSAHPPPINTSSLSSSTASSSALPSSSALNTNTVIAPSLTASPSSAAFSRSTVGTSAPASETGTNGGGSGRELPLDPMSWEVGDVVEWARQKGFDKLTVSKFEEHEISGDVLLEMDVAMLKEIDLVAFGRRVHIYNAIKELRNRTHPELHRASGSNLAQSTRSASGGSYLSPAMSGYEAGVDSPQQGYGQSPTMGSFAAAGQYSREHLQGLGFEEGSQAGSSLRAPSSLGQQSVSNLRSSTSRSNNSHQRSTTFDSINTDAAPPLSASSGVAPRLPSPVPPKPRVSTGPEGLTTEGDTTDVGVPPKREKKSLTRPPTATSTAAATASLAAEEKSRLRSSKSQSRNMSGKQSSGGESAPPSPNPNGLRKSSKSESANGERKGSFFGATLPGLPGRSRKPPPRVPSGLLLDSDGTVPRPRPRSSLQDRAKRSTRLFGFASTSGSEKSPTALDSSIRSRNSNSTLGNPREASTTMKAKEVDPTPKAMLREKEDIVRDGNLMDKIGRADHSGWMKKKGEKYNTWKMRFFVLKGVYLYYLKSEAEQKAKGVIDLTGYRILSDANIHPGEFGFKIVHDREKTHFFAAAEQITVRNWMKEIMKATILRDYSAPVVSSCDIEVLPLDVAQTMTPYPRPPSPSRRAAIQKERYAGTNPNTLSQKDAAILMDFAPGSPLMNGEALWSSASSKPKNERKTSAVSLARSAGSDAPTEHAPGAGSPLFGDATPKLNGASSPSLGLAQTRLLRAASDTSKGELLAWLNANLPSTCPLATDLAFSLRSGRLLVRVLENLTGEGSGISDESFEQFHQQEGLPFDTAYLDTIFSVFDFLSPRVSTDEISMEDMITGNEERLTLLVQRIRGKYPTPAL